MSDLEKQIEDSFRELDISEVLLPLTPTQRIEKPKRTKFQPNDIVQILVNDNAGLFGQIVVERNGNYVDRLHGLWGSDDDIGLIILDPPYDIKEEISIYDEVLWFNSADQLDLVFPTPDQEGFFENRFIPPKPDSKTIHWSL